MLSFDKKIVKVIHSCGDKSRFKFNIFEFWDTISRGQELDLLSVEVILNCPNGPKLSETAPQVTSVICMFTRRAMAESSL